MKSWAGEVSSMSPTVLEHEDAKESFLAIADRCFTPNSAPPDFDPAVDLPEGFLAFVLPLHHAFTPRQQELVAARAGVLAAAHRGERPDHLPPSEATTGEWKTELPMWCADQRNQMT